MPAVPSQFVPKLFATLRGYDLRLLAGDLTAGVTVGIVVVPPAIAFAVGDENLTSSVDLAVATARVHLGFERHR